MSRKAVKFVPVLKRSKLFGGMVIATAGLPLSLAYASAVAAKAGSDAVGLWLSDVFVPWCSDGGIVILPEACPADFSKINPNTCDTFDLSDADIDTVAGLFAWVSGSDVPEGTASPLSHASAVTAGD